MEAIYDAGASLDVAITLSDERAKTKSGRVYLDRFCIDNGVDLIKVASINDPATIAAIARYDLDYLFIIGWSQIAKAEILALPRLAAIGMHPTLLPEGRGRAAIPWAILKRLERTGVTMFQLDSGVDTGPIIAQGTIPLTDTTTATELYRLVDQAHVHLMRQTIPKLEAGTVSPLKQDEAGATVWEGRKPEDGEIDRDGSVHDAECLVRAVTHPYPGAFIVRDDHKLIIWAARIVEQPGENPAIRFADGWLELLEVEERPLTG
ncbi:methionyl-tRNA formyltransferase [Qipengyuania oceanensis]|uniref:Methionyl-tRNA formyltransferase n=1 Tax=Qipengyuania oceanensis TaxID=1463597 RepID=A0A844YJ73_9SPHN|nr:formyltransferase family protein [Qipengyuania oceanensis]MXO63098.1 methionyl-tRNA formyltransferase [Qipengyuania oceanensis]